MMTADRPMASFHPQDERPPQGGDRDSQDGPAQHPDPPPASSSDSSDGPLTDEQLAFYRRRLESGFYRTPDVQRRIAERVTDDLLAPGSDRR